MIWILESDIFEENLKGLVKEIEQQGHKPIILSDSTMSVLENRSFSDQIPNHLDEPNIFYGSLEMADMVLRYTNWNVFRTLKNYRCSTYYPQLFPYLLNAKESAFLTFRQIKEQKDWALDQFGSQSSTGERCIFVRPNDGKKSFTGQVVWEDSWDKDIQLMCFYDTPEDLMCVVSPPKTITEESRFVVCDKKVIAGSEYQNKFGTQFELDANDYHYQYAQDIVNKINWEPDPIWTLDVCTIKTNINSYCAVLEIGSFSCAGLYDCNQHEVVKHVTKKCEDLFAELV